MNSTLGSVVPLAMFIFNIFLPELSQESKGHILELKIVIPVLFLKTDSPHIAINDKFMK